jgi:hypothetical protein
LNFALVTGKLKSETGPQQFDGLASEAGQFCVEHQLHDVNDVLPVWPDGQVGVHALESIL